MDLNFQQNSSLIFEISSLKDEVVGKEIFNLDLCVPLVIDSERISVISEQTNLKQRGIRLIGLPIDSRRQLLVRMKCLNSLQALRNIVLAPVRVEVVLFSEVRQFDVVSQRLLWRLYLLEVDNWIVDGVEFIENNFALGIVEFVVGVLLLPVNLALNAVMVGHATVVIVLYDHNAIVPDLELGGLHDELGGALLFQQLLLLFRFELVGLGLVVLVGHVRVHDFFEGELLFVELIHKLLGCPARVNRNHGPISVESQVLVVDYVENGPLPINVRHAVPNIVDLFDVDAIESDPGPDLDHVPPAFELLQEGLGGLGDVAGPQVVLAEITKDFLHHFFVV